MKPEKPHEIVGKGKLVKWAYRKVGYKIAILLVNTGIKPNTITVFRFVCAIVASFLIASQDFKIQVTGVFFLQSFSILDKTDGGLARIKNKESQLGAWLDSNFDVLGVVFANIGLWYSVRNESHILAILTMLTIFLFVFLKLNRLKRKIILKDTRQQRSISNGLLESTNADVYKPLLSIYRVFINQFSTNGRSMVLLLSLGVVCSIEKYTIFFLFFQVMLTWLHLFISVTLRLSQENNK